MTENNGHAVPHSCRPGAEPAQREHHLDGVRHVDTAIRETVEHPGRERAPAPDQRHGETLGRRIVDERREPGRELDHPVGRAMRRDDRVRVILEEPRRPQVVIEHVPLRLELGREPAVENDGGPARDPLR